MTKQQAKLLEAARRLCQAARRTPQGEVAFVVHESLIRELEQECANAEQRAA